MHRTSCLPPRTNLPGFSSSDGPSLFVERIAVGKGCLASIRTPQVVHPLCVQHAIRYLAISSFIGDGDGDGDDLTFQRLASTNRALGPNWSMPNESLQQLSTSRLHLENTGDFD